MRTNQQLIDEVDLLIELAEVCQTNGDTIAARDLRHRYLVWYGEAKKLVSEEQREDFRDMYEGGAFVSRIRSFLEDPTKQSPLYNEAEPNPLVSPYACPVETTFTPNIRRQEEILIARVADDEAALPARDLEYVANHVERLGDLVAALGRRYNNRDPFEVKDEYDLQDLLDGVLRLFDDDVEREDFAPKMSGVGSRLDWIMRTLGIAVEAKYCRPSDKRGKVRDELLSDLATFRGHPQAGSFLAVVYDPLFTLENPVGFSRDLERHGNEVLPTRILLIPKR